MADKVIMTPGVLYGELMAAALTLTGKGGTCVVTADRPDDPDRGRRSTCSSWRCGNKEVKGTIFGSLNPRADIPNLLVMYRERQLKLDELITNRYPLDDINDGYQDMRDGKNIRGVVVHGS